MGNINDMLEKVAAGIVTQRTEIGLLNRAYDQLDKEAGIGSALSSAYRKGSIASKRVAGRGVRRAAKKAVKAPGRAKESIKETAGKAREAVNEATGKAYKAVKEAPGNAARSASDAARKKALKVSDSGKVRTMDDIAARSARRKTINNVADSVNRNAKGALVVGAASAAGAATGSALRGDKKKEKAAAFATIKQAADFLASN